MSTNIPKTVWGAMEQYASCCENNRFSMLRTAIERYAVPGWDGPLAQEGQKVSIRAQEFLRQLPITELPSVLTALEAGFKLLNLNNDGKKKYRSYVKKFLIFCEGNWVLSSIDKKDYKTHKNLDKENPYRLQEVDGSRKIYQISSTGVKRGLPFSLGTQSTHFSIIDGLNTDTHKKLYCIALKCSSHVSTISFLFIFKHVLGNKVLHQELNELANYFSDLDSLPDIMDKTLAMLGYLHQIQNVPLNELSLTKLVPYTKQIYSEIDFIGNPDFELDKDGIPHYPDRVDAKLTSIEKLAKRKSQQQAIELVQWVEEFLEWLDSRQIELGSQKGAAIAYKRFHITVLIYIAKFTYKSETRSKFYTDIEIINKLKEKRNSLKINKDEQKNRVAAHCITWKETALVAEMQRELADTRYGVPHIKTYGLYPVKRRSSAIASDIQALVILLLMMLIPCDRQETYRRLELRETLKIDEAIEGAFILLGQFQDKVFVPKAKMANPDEAEWWLSIHEFKTINKYGSFWYPLPNHQFMDGKTFYEYLEMWFFGLYDVEGKWDEYYDYPNEKWQGHIDKSGQRCGWRSALDPSHSFAFSKPRTQTPHDKDSLCSLIKSIFIKFTPLLDRGEIVPVTPHRLRTMLATYTEGKLTPSEELSMAYCEHHSLEKRKDTYTITDNMRKITDAINVMNRINQELYLSRNRTILDINKMYLEVLNYLDGSFLQKISISVLDAVNSYKNICKSTRFSMLKTAIERYAIAGWGGPIAIKGKHINFDSETFLKDLSIVYLLTIETAIEKGCKYIGVSSRTKDKNLSYVRKFLDFCKQQGWFFDLYSKHVILNKFDSIKYLHSLLKERPKTIEFLLTGVSSTPAFGLGTQLSDYLCCVQKKQQILGSIELHEELSEFENYLSGTSKAKDILYKIRQVLGYLHRIKEVPLAELRLTKIIPFIKLIYCENDFINDPDFELGDDGLPKQPDKVEQKLSAIEGIVNRRSEIIAQELSNFLDEYFGHLDQNRIHLGAQGLAEGTKLDHLHAFITLAKYLYRNQSRSQDFSDVVVVKGLREQRSNYKPEKRKQKARVGSRCITWEETIQVVEMQRELADIRHYIELQPHKSSKFRLRQKKPAGVAAEIQKVLLLMLMTLIPCDRQQTYRRLEFRESLKFDGEIEGAYILRGTFLEGEFIPSAQMQDTEQATWWLAVYNFKTIKKYGPFWYPLPNQHFIDGKTFYEYLEMWFFGLEDLVGKWPQYYKGNNAKWQGYIDHDGKRQGWRMALKPKCDFAFFGPKSGGSFTKETFGQLIKNVFIRFTPLVRQEIVPVTPHSFRTTFSTYTCDKLTSIEEESIAYCEHHSVKTRREEYTLFDNMRQISDAIKVMERINNHVFNGHALDQS